jgi:hypothetical protein
MTPHGNAHDTPEVAGNGADFKADGGATALQAPRAFTLVAAPIKPNAPSCRLPVCGPECAKRAAR